MLEYGRVEHSEAVKLAIWPALIVTIASIAVPIRFHQAAVPGERHCPELPNATVGHSLETFKRFV